jgi:DNA-binding transcriptional LysR family regulator
MVQEGIDLSIRIARDLAPPFGARRLAPIRRVFCAAPDYLARAGTPTDPDDLTRHNCLLAGTDQPFDDWPILRDGRPSTVKVSGNLMTNSVDALHQALLDGAGIAFVGTFLVGEDLKRGKLVEILAGQAVQGAQLFAATPHHRFTPRKVEVFIDHVAEWLGSPPYWDR